MKKPHDMSELLSAYLDGELPPEQARRIEHALRDDPALAEELAGLKAVREMLRSLPRGRAGDDFVSRVMERVERANLITEPARADDRGALSWARHFATAALVLIALGVGGVVAVTVWKTPQRMYTTPTGPIAAHQEKPDSLARDLSKDAQGWDRDREGRREQADTGDGKPVQLGYFIEAQDLELAKASIEGVLQRSGVEPAKAREGEGKGQARGVTIAGANSFEFHKRDDGQLQYRLSVGADEAKKIQTELAQLCTDKKAAAKPETAENRQATDPSFGKAPGDAPGVATSDSPEIRIGNEPGKSPGIANAPSPAAPATPEAQRTPGGTDRPPACGLGPAPARAPAPATAAAAATTPAVVPSTLPGTDGVLGAICRLLGDGRPGEKDIVGRKFDSESKRGKEEEKAKDYADGLRKDAATAPPTAGPAPSGVAAPATKPHGEGAAKDVAIAQSPAEALRPGRSSVGMAASRPGEQSATQPEDGGLYRKQHEAKAAAELYAKLKESSAGRAASREGLEKAMKKTSEADRYEILITIDRLDRPEASARPTEAAR